MPVKHRLLLYPLYDVRLMGDKDPPCSEVRGPRTLSTTGRSRMERGKDSGHIIRGIRNLPPRIPGSHIIGRCYG